MIITRSALTVRCARCGRDVKNFTATFVPGEDCWRGTAYCHNDSVAFRVRSDSDTAIVFGSAAVLPFPRPPAHEGAAA